jgi:hypothetical protein
MIIRWCTTFYHVGTIIGQNYGVAKKATAIAVRVFDATGKGSSAYVHNKT